MKALNNLLSALGLLAAAEVLLIGERSGLDPKVMLEVLNASSGWNHATQHKVDRFILSETYDSGFSLDLMVKDLHHATELASDVDEAALALTSTGVTAWDEALASLGPGHDHTEVALWVRRLCEGSRADA